MEKYAKQNKGDAKIKKLVKTQVQSMIRSRQELKSFDTGLAQTVSSTGNVIKLTTIPQGDTDSTRDGDQINITKLEGVVVGTCSTDTTNILRCTIIRWNGDDTTDAPTIAKVYQTSASPFISALVRDNLRSNYMSVVQDDILCVGATSPQIEKSRYSHKWKALKCNYESGTNTGVGQLYAIVSSDSTAVAHPSLTCMWRVYYTDS